MASMFQKSLAGTYKLVAKQYGAATNTKKIKMKASSRILIVNLSLTILVHLHGRWIFRVPIHAQQGHGICQRVQNGSKSTELSVSINRVRSLVCADM